MVTPHYSSGRKEGRMPSSCLSTFEKRRHVAMDILVPLPEGRWEGGHDLCPSLLDKWRSVAMVTPMPLLDRNGFCPDPLPHFSRRRMGMWPWSPQGHPQSLF